MTVVISGSGDNSATGISLSSRSTNRSKPSCVRYSSTRIHNTNYINSSSIQGGHPLSGVDPSGSKMDIKHRFEITAKLGSGTYGKVSLAFDHKMEREVAVKLIKKSAIENKQDLIRIRREIRIMSMLKHPNIIEIYEVFENKDKIILVMEYANGGELYDYVSKFGSLPEAEARRLFRQITSAVLYCHKHKVAHRDLKLENILLDSRNNAKIADFGLSNYFNEKSLLTTFCGSPLYASPEIINGTPYKGPEVDCWSLGILLYTLVYGSMPFDGRDFNRMVRQIKRGSYYEPDTPSTASMLIRNMLRVNPERRADIDDIASHWWLNLEENMPVIQELPENQIIDHTPLTERAEIMVVQDLADETDVFMEFGHLSAATRRKIEEFRRRRKEAEEYNENSPIKPPKAKRTLKKNSEVELSSKEKSLRYQEEPKSEKTQKKENNVFQDPLERLRQLETQLQGFRCADLPETSKTETFNEKKITNKNNITEEPIYNQVSSNVQKSSTKEKSTRKKSLRKTKKNSVEKNDTLNDAFVKQKSKDELLRTNENVHSMFKKDVSNISQTNTKTENEDNLAIINNDVSKSFKYHPRQYWKLETDSLNILMNQVLEQMEKGSVSMNLIARIKAHVFYNQRPMVKELLESIILAQPPQIQKEASKLILQQSQELVRRQNSMHTSMSGSISKKTSIENATQNKLLPLKSKISNAKTSGLKTTKPFIEEIEEVDNEYKKKEVQNVVDVKKTVKKTALNERPWHSVEVGFSTDEDSSSSISSESNDTNELFNKKKYSKNIASAPKFVDTRVIKSEPFKDEYEDEEEYFDAENNEEEYESDIDELAEVVEQVAATKSKADITDKKEDLLENNDNSNKLLPKIVESLAENLQSPKIITGESSAQSANYLSTLERGLAKRQSKGKYQFLHNQVEMYGRGVSMEADSPPPSKRRIGGPQPRLEQSPILFDKAKDYLMNPNKVNEKDDIKTFKKSNCETNTGKKHENWIKNNDTEISDAKSSNSTITPNSTVETNNSTRKKEKNSAESNNEKKKTEEDEDEEDEKESGEEEEEEEESSDEEEESSEEESDDENAQPFRPRPSTIIGFRTIQPVGADGIVKEAPIVKVKPQTNNNQASLPPQKKLSNPRFNINPYTKQLENQHNFRKSSTEKHSSHFRNNDFINEPTKTFGNSILGMENGFNQNSSHNENENFAEKEKKHNETVSAYIRRKNRERRARNQTIAIIDKAYFARSLDHAEIWHNESEKLQYNDSKRRSSLANNMFSFDRFTENNSNNYRRPSYGDDRRSQHDLSHFKVCFVKNLNDRRKSFHELTPNCDLYDDNGYLSNERYNNYPPTSTNLSRFEDEVINAFYPNSASEINYPNESLSHRFEVYRTRAERAAETNPYRSNGGYHHNERPTSAYVPNVSCYKSSKYDDPYYNGNYPSSGVEMSTGTHHRRSYYEPDRLNELSEYSLPNNHAHSEYSENCTGNSTKDSEVFSRLRPVNRRILNLTMQDSEGKRNQARSQSNDQMFFVIRDEFDSTNENGNLNSKYGMTNNYYEPNRHYGSQQARDYESNPTSNILKNKNINDNDVKGTLTKDVKLENSTVRTIDFVDLNDVGTKKRNFLNMARRRTTEVSSNLLRMNDDYKRPRSPVDRLKSSFRNKNFAKDNLVNNNLISNTGVSYTPSTSIYGNHNLPSLLATSGISSTYTTRYTTSTPLTEKLTLYNHNLPITTNKRFGGTTTSRFNYSNHIGTARSSPRSWYDESHHY